MGVEKGESFVGHPLQAGGLDLAVGVGGGDISDAEVVGHDEDDIGTGRGGTDVRSDEADDCSQGEEQGGNAIWLHGLIWSCADT